ncbi:MAG: hypothetical protein HKN57_10890 [Xanthomonadales bacterium]|nr:hypothetical protein [Xanthomonadales bacterium]
MMIDPPRLTLWALLALLQLPGELAAATPEGDIRLQPARQGAVWVGQELELQLELWSDGFSFGDQLFVLPEVTGGFLLQADSSTVKLTEKRDGVTWQGLRYSLLFYPQRAGRLQVPSFEVRFSASAGFGTEPSRFRFQTSPLPIEAKLPPGAAGNGLLVTTTSFDMDFSWTPEVSGETPVELKVGDALTLQVNRRADSVPGMVFALLPEFSIEGLGVYPETPAVEDRINRGELTGNRTDSVTFICEREGSYTLPELRFQWWDPERETLSEQIIPAVSLAVAANPAYQTSPTAAGEPGEPGLDWKLTLGIVALILLAAYLLRRVVHRAALAVHHWLEARKAGEAWAFSQVRKSCAANSPAAAYNAISVWLQRFDPQAGLNLLDLAATRGNQDLMRESIRLQENLTSGSGRDWNGGRMAALLARIRKDASRTETPGDDLPPLNPPVRKR